MIYSGIGSRKTPLHYQFFMTVFAFCVHGTLRSGGAEGADLAFEIGANDKEIYLPCEKFNDNTSSLVVTGFDNFKEIEQVAEAIHPNWNACKPFAKLLHSRNVCQVLGKDLDQPTDFVICWTPDGANNRTQQVTSNTGGTGTAITLAGRFDIPVFNLYNTDDLQMMYDFAKNNNFMNVLNELSDTVGQGTLSLTLDMLSTIKL